MRTLTWMVAAAALIGSTAPAERTNRGAGGSPPPAPRVVHGRCVDCTRPFRLGHIQFVSDRVGWASAFELPPGNGSGSSAILRTTDGGRTWKQIPFAEQRSAEAELPFWFVDENRGWIAHFDAWTATGALSHTSDGGRTWAHRTFGPIAALQFFDALHGFLVEAGIDSLAFRTTTDGGVDWSRIALPLSHASAMSFANRRAGIIAGRLRTPSTGELAIVFTRDGGLHWTPARLPERLAGATVIDLQFVDDQLALPALARANDGGAALLETNDGGATWKRHDAPPFGDRRRTVTAIAIRPDGHGALFYDDTSASRSGVATTADGGRTWGASAFSQPVTSCEARGRSAWCSSGLDIVQVPF